MCRCIIGEPMTSAHSFRSLVGWLFYIALHMCLCGDPLTLLRSKVIRVTLHGFAFVLALDSSCAPNCLVFLVCCLAHSMWMS